MCYVDENDVTFESTRTGSITVKGNSYNTYIKCLWCKRFLNQVNKLWWSTSWSENGTI